MVTSNKKFHNIINNYSNPNLDEAKMTSLEIAARVENLYQEQQAQELLSLLQQGVKVPAHSIEPFIKQAVNVAFRNPRDPNFNSAKTVKNLNFENHLSSLYKIANFTPANRIKFWNGYKDMQKDFLDSEGNTVSKQKKAKDLAQKREFFETKKKKRKIKKFRQEMEYEHALMLKEEERKKKEYEEFMKNSTFAYWLKHIAKHQHEIMALVEKEIIRETKAKPESENIGVSNAMHDFQNLFFSYMKDFENNKVKKIPTLDFLMAGVYLNSLPAGQKTRLTENNISFPEMNTDGTYPKNTTVTALSNSQNKDVDNMDTLTSLLKAQVYKQLHMAQQIHIEENTAINLTDNLKQSLILERQDNKIDSANAPKNEFVIEAQNNMMSPSQIIQVKAISSLLDSVSSNNLDAKHSKYIQQARTRLLSIIRDSKLTPNMQKTNVSQEKQNLIAQETKKELASLNKDLIQFQEQVIYDESQLLKNGETTPYSPRRVVPMVPTTPFTKPF